MLIGLLDYGVGNLGSMRSALKQINSDFIDLTNAEGISKVDCLIIPGVGSFNTGVRNISQNNMYDEIVNFAKSGKRLLGVCLGHQAIGAALGGKVSRAPELLHGKTSQVQHKNEGVFKDIKSPFRATRYHSLVIETLSVPEELIVTATTESGVIMGVKHKSAPIDGVQFHPESVLTEGGHQLLANWLKSADPGESNKIDNHLQKIIKF